MTHPGRHVVPLREAARAWFLISWQTFGGPAGQIAVMHRELVEERRWIGERRFLHAMSFCLLLPGPEAQQLAVYSGWLLNGWVGGVIAGGLFVLPGFLTILALSWVYVAHGDSTLVTGVLLGLAAAVIPIVVQAVLRLGRRSLHSRLLVGLAVAAFVALAVLAVPFPLVVLASGVAGWLLGRWRPDLARRPEPDDSDAPAPLIPDDALHTAPRSARRSLAYLVAGLVLWAAPVAAAYALAGGQRTVFTDQGLFFGGMALVTFGGAYAVLSYVAQAAVEHYGWLTAQEMVRGLALAETTPGPLIMVVQFVAFLGAFRDPGSLGPWTAAVLASVLVVWVTFVPCFLFVFVGAPYVERLRDNRSLSAALTGVGAAVVGVIANLALYFAVHTLFAEAERIGGDHLGLLVPVWSSFQWQPAVLAALGATLVFGLRWPVLRTLGVCGLAGLIVAVLT
ncbi:chromate efflux transporter [Nocardioides sp.]|uniref:chromate efflux transporter n=1 Tax=Nocardioides sp. TaxID=35761 RepID=UPI003782EAE4